jgi:16S rRNA (uracil1498-N3)-methyltransferase
MTRRRWIADEVDGDHAALVGEHADHLVRVLRARVGQEFDIATDKSVRIGLITAIKTGRVEFELGDEVPQADLAEINLFLSVHKFDRMEWAIEKCTELGVARIIPVIARRTDAHLASASTKRVERWRRIARQAAEQSRRPAPPDISHPTKLSEVLEFSADLRIVLAETESRVLFREVMKSGFGKRLAMAIGPEGGWTEDELQLFGHAGWISASLGYTILRAETAAIAATAIAASVLL